MTASIAARYNFVLKDQAGASLALFDNFSSLNFVRAVDDIGQFQIAFADNSDSRFDLFAKDCLSEIWRTVPGVGLDWYCEFRGFVRRIRRETEETGHKIFQVSGYDYNHLLQRRQIAYRQGTTRAEKDNYIEDIMKQYVDENCGPGANHASRIRNGVFTNFSIEAISALHTQTANWKGDRSFQQVLSILQELSKFSLTTVPASRSMDFGVEDNGAGAFIFRTYIDQMGDDRTADSLTATPAIFSVELGNLANIEHDQDGSKEANAMIVLGKGERSTRKVICREDATAGALSPWNDIETIVSASLNEFEYQLNNAGDAALQEHGAIDLFAGKPLQTPSTLYGLHYFLGDIITIQHAGIVRDKKINKVSISLDEKGDKIDIDFED